MAAGPRAGPSQHRRVRTCAGRSGCQVLLLATLEHLLRFLHSLWLLEAKDSGQGSQGLSGCAGSASGRRGRGGFGADPGLNQARGLGPAWNSIAGVKKQGVKITD